MTATVELEWAGSPGATIKVPVESPDGWDVALITAMLHATQKWGAKDFTSAKVTTIE